MGMRRVPPEVTVGLGVCSSGSSSFFQPANDPSKPPTRLLFVLPADAATVPTPLPVPDVGATP